MAVAALLALAIVFVWPPVDSGFAAPHDHTAASASHSDHPQGEHNSPQRGLHAAADADCNGSAIGCCVMTLCHPGLSVAPHELPVIAANDVTIAARAVRGLGSDPGVILPPPRGLPV